MDSPDTRVGTESAGWRRCPSWEQHVQDRSCMTRCTWDCLGDLRQDLLYPYIICKEPARAGSQLQDKLYMRLLGGSSPSGPPVSLHHLQGTSTCRIAAAWHVAHETVWRIFSVRTSCVFTSFARNQHVQDRSCVTRGT